MKWGGIEEADRICTDWGRVAGHSKNFKALLSSGEPLYDGHDLPEAVNAADRFELSGPLIVYDSADSPRVILSEAE